MSLRDRQQVEDNNGHNDYPLGSGRQRRHRGHTVLYPDKGERGRSGSGT